MKKIWYKRKTRRKISKTNYTQISNGDAGDTKLYTCGSAGRPKPASNSSGLIRRTQNSQSDISETGDARNEEGMKGLRER